VRRVVRFTPESRHVECQLGMSVTTPTIGGRSVLLDQPSNPNAVTPHSGSYRFARNRSKEDRRDSPALLSGLGSQELRGVYRLI